MNIDYLDVVLSTCMTLRKMKNVIIEENKIEFSMRPQLHILIVSPFGTFKSSLTKNLEKKFPKFIYPIDDFTKPGIEGSISKDGEYVPPLLTRIGGKILIIDEWNSIDFYAQGSLLGVLENQRVSRILGFKVKKPFKMKCAYGSFLIDENKIDGEMQFSCIAYAMEYPINSQKDKALISRFTPLFLEPTLDYIKAHTRGEFEVSVNDYSYEVENITVCRSCYNAFHEKYFDFLIEHDIVPEDSDDYGYISRVMSDVIRMGIYNFLKKNPEIAKGNKTILIDDDQYFVEMFPYAMTLLQQLNNPKTKGKIDQYKEMLKKYPGKSKEFYYTALGITRQTLYIYDKKIYGNKVEVQEVNFEVVENVKK